MCGILIQDWMCAGSAFQPTGNVPLNYPLCPPSFHTLQALRSEALFVLFATFFIKCLCMLKACCERHFGNTDNNNATTAVHIHRHMSGW